VPSAPARFVASLPQQALFALGIRFSSGPSFEVNGLLYVLVNRLHGSGPRDEKDVNKIFDAIQPEVDEARSKFSKPQKGGIDFSLEWSSSAGAQEARQGLLAAIARLTC
jgi:hypothetical protein